MNRTVKKLRAQFAMLLALVMVLGLVPMGLNALMYDDPENEPAYTPAPEYMPIYVPEYVPIYVPEYMPEYVPEYEPECAPECAPEYMPEYEPEYDPEYDSEYEPEYDPVCTPEYAPEYAPESDTELDPEYSSEEDDFYDDEHICEFGYIDFMPFSLSPEHITVQIMNPITNSYSPAAQGQFANMGTLPSIIPDIAAVKALPHFDNIDWSMWRVASWTLGLAVSPGPGTPDVYTSTQQQVRTDFPIQHTLPDYVCLDTLFWGTNPIFRFYLEQIPPTLTGTVTCDDTGRQIPSVSVRLYERNEDGSYTFLRYEVTDENGFFDFNEVPVRTLYFK